MMMQDKDQAFKDLKRFKMFTDSLDITFWLDWGTLLGAVREGKFIDWEQDIDLGFIKKDLEMVYHFKEELEKRGFRLFPKPEGFAAVAKGRTSKLDLGCYDIKGKYAFQYCEVPNRIGNMIDLILFILNKYDAEYKYETMLDVNKIKRFITIISFIPTRVRLNMIAIFKKLNQTFGTVSRFTVKNPKHYFTNLEQIKFYNDYFFIPSNALKYLTLVYGEDWEVPKNFLEGNKWNEFRNIEES